MVTYPLPDGMTNRGRLSATAKKPTKRHNKQHDARASSFKRIAKSLRTISRPPLLPANKLIALVAKAFDDEAKLLRSMR